MDFIKKCLKFFKNQRYDVEQRLGASYSTQSVSSKCDQSTAWQILRQIWDSTLRQAQMLAYLQKILGTQGVANLES